MAAVSGRYSFQRSLRSDIRNSGHMHHLRRVFGAIVKLLLTVDEPEDQDTMQAILTTMGHSEFRDAAEWLATGIHNKPCLNCSRFSRWYLVEEQVLLPLCAGCILCLPRRPGCVQCPNQKLGEFKFGNLSCARFE